MSYRSTSVKRSGRGECPQATTRRQAADLCASCRRGTSVVRCIVSWSTLPKLKFKQRAANRDAGPSVGRSAHSPSTPRVGNIEVPPDEVAGFFDDHPCEHARPQGGGDPRFANAHFRAPCNHDDHHCEQPCGIDEKRGHSASFLIRCSNAASRISNCVSIAFKVASFSISSGR